MAIAEDDEVFKVLDKAASIAPNVGSEVVTSPAPVPRGAFADLFGRIAGRQLVPGAYLLNPRRYADIQKWSATDLDQVSLNILVETGQFGVLYGTRLIVSTRLPMDKIYVTTTPDKVGRMPGTISGLQKQFCMKNLTVAGTSEYLEPPKRNSVQVRTISRRSKMKRSFEFKKLTSKMAYVIGALLGDGSVTESGTIQLFSIDKEFVECVKYYCESFLGTTPEIREYQFSKPGFYGKKTKGWMYEFDCIDFAKWFLEVTDNKKKVPNIIPVATCEETKYFCEGFLDAKGWVSKTSKVTSSLGTHWYDAGVCNKNLDLLNGVISRLELLGVAHKKLTVIKSELNDKVEYVYGLPMASLCKGKINFRIKRKRERLEEYKNLNFKKPWNKDMTRNG